MIPILDCVWKDLYRQIFTKAFQQMAQNAQKRAIFEYFVPNFHLFIESPIVS